MSFEEKSTWITASVTALVSGVYFAIILGQMRDTPVTAIAYQRLLLVAVGVAVVLTVIASIVTAVTSPKDRDKKDERDVDIKRYGEYIGYYVLAVGAAGVLGLTMLEVAYFWIANALYLAFVLATLVSSAVKLYAYRRGL